MTVTNLTATDLDGDGKFELIGSFVIATEKKFRRDLFLIAEPQGANYKAALVLGNTRSLPELFGAFGITFPFTQEAVEDALQFVAAETHQFNQ